MSNTITFKEDFFLNESHLVKAGAEAKIVKRGKDRAIIVLANDPFKEEYLIEKSRLELI